MKSQKIKKIGEIILESVKSPINISEIIPINEVTKIKEIGEIILKSVKRRSPLECR